MPTPRRDALRDFTAPLRPLTPNIVAPLINVHDAAHQDRGGDPMSPLPNPAVHAQRPRRVFRFAYFVNGGRHGRDLLLHQLRDADAALYLMQALHACGFVYGDPVLNYPCARPPAAGPIPVDDSWLGPGDLLLLTTRPPLDDADDAVKSRVHRSHTSLEARIFAALRRHLSRCSRSQVIVADEHVRANPAFARLRNIEYKQRRGAPVHRILPEGAARWHGPFGDDEAFSLGYLIYEEHAWPGGPALLAVFGMSGTETLVLNRFVANQHPELICSVPFAMARLTRPAGAGAQTMSNEFAQGWDITLVN
jgi:hypothetical protein